MASFVQALGGVELNAESFLHLENFCKNFLVDGLENVTTLTQCRNVEKIPLGNVVTFKINVLTWKSKPLYNVAMLVLTLRH